MYDVASNEEVLHDHRRQWKKLEWIIWGVSIREFVSLHNT